MGRLLAVACLTSLAFLLGCDIPAPAQYDHAMLREYFGKSPKEIEDAFGQPSSVAHADSQVAPPEATKEERERFNQTTEGMRYLYSTVDGDLVFHFSLANMVHAITYRGSKVSPPH